MCSLVCISNFRLLENKDTHYLLFYYSFTNMSMNSFARINPSGSFEGGLPYVNGPFGAAMWLLNQLPAASC
jgi:hypothetical protein